LRRFGGGDLFHHAPSQSTNLTGTIDRVGAGCEKLFGDAPTGIDGFGHQYGTFHDERAVLGTRSAASRETPHPLNR
jgi:hypothetical protein